MNILYISNIGPDKASGLCWSVPAGVNAQQRYDNCLWINLNDSELNHWKEVSCFTKITEIGNRLNIDNLPTNFMQPDLVVFEGFYNLDSVRFSKVLNKNGIPYIIVPRGSLSKQAFRNHSFLNYLKKKIAMGFVFRNYTRKALAIQYLTQSEFEDSGNKWNKSNIIVPNGINISTQYKESFSTEGIKGVFIGRPSLKHKGLDLLIRTCVMVQSEMRKENFVIDCHMPKKNDYDEVVRLIKSNNIEDILRPQEAVFDYQKKLVLLSSDVFILPSRFEGHPMGLIEALSFGIPVAVTPGSNMMNEIEVSDSGWTSDGSVEGMVKMFRAIMSEKELFQAKGLNARSLSYNYSWDGIARQFHEKITALLS